MLMTLALRCAAFVSFPVLRSGNTKTVALPATFAVRRLDRGDVEPSPRRRMKRPVERKSERWFSRSASLPALCRRSAPEPDSPVE